MATGILMVTRFDLEQAIRDKDSTFLLKKEAEVALRGARRRWGNAKRRVEELCGQLGLAEADVRDGMPDEVPVAPEELPDEDLGGDVCSECQGAGGKCLMCLGTGWIEAE